jgi:succinate-acetate transporter protein
VTGGPPPAIFFGGFARRLAGMWAFAERSTFATAAFAVEVVLATLVPAFALIGIGTGAYETTLVDDGAGFGLACACAAAFTAFAHVVNRTFGERELLPVGSRS